MNTKFFAPLPPGRPTSLEHAEILVMRRAGHSYGGISLLLDVPYQTVASACQRAGLGGRRNLTPCTEEIQRLFKLGHRYKEIAVLTRTNYSTVRSICQRVLHV